ncbi:CRISPR-associated protein Csm3 [Candidatus Methanophagaceae archaeon]|nr:CRISPR-associated protein Csm3 [Methanophagales archaeon]
MTLKFDKNIRINGKIVCLTGLHVGGVAETMEIGGTGNPVIMDRIKNIPIIPGSSLKGKIRGLLELNGGLYEQKGDVCRYWTNKEIEELEKRINKEHDENKKEELNAELESVKKVLPMKRDLCLVFGRGASEEVEAGPTRLIVRDAFPTEETRKIWERNEDLVHGTEIKGENAINRITSEANPRFPERVPAGSEFNFEMIYSVYQKKDLDRLKMLFEGMSLLEDNYLGGSGSRGYGNIGFKDLEFMQKTKEDYQEGKEWEVVKGTESLKIPSAILNWLKDQKSKKE